MSCVALVTAAAVQLDSGPDKARNKDATGDQTQQARGTYKQETQITKLPRNFLGSFILSTQNVLERDVTQLMKRNPTIGKTPRTRLGFKCVFPPVPYERGRG